MKKIYALFICLILMIAVATAAVIEMPVAPAIAHISTQILGSGVPSGGGAAEIVGSSVEASGTTTDPLEFSYTMESGSDLALVVFVYSNVALQSTVTYNGDTMTQVVYQVNGYWVSSEIHVLTNPDTGGSYTISVNYDGSPEYGVRASAITVKNVDQSTPASDTDSSFATGTASSVTIANMTANDLALAATNGDHLGETVGITTGTLIDTGGGGTNYCDTGEGYNTGTGNVDVTFSRDSAAYTVAGFRLNGAS